MPGRQELPGGINAESARLLQGAWATPHRIQPTAAGGEELLRDRERVEAALQIVGGVWVDSFIANQIVGRDKQGAKGGAIYSQGGIKHGIQCQ